jgi:Immunity protein 35
MTTLPSLPVTREVAADIAQGAITRLKHGAHLALLPERIIEKEWGWVFHFNTRQFVETRDPQALLPGCGPLVVERVDGAYTFLSTSMAPDVALEMYERCRSRALKLAPQVS